MFSPYHASRPAVSIHSNFFFVTQKGVDTEMELGMQTFGGLGG